MDFKSRSSTRWILIAIIIGAIIIAIGLGLGLGFGLRDYSEKCVTSENQNGGNTGNQNGINFNKSAAATFKCVTSENQNGGNTGNQNGINFNKSAAATFKYATVDADSKIASDIGNDILARKRGNAIDAMVAAMFATGLMSSHSCGIGGGSFIVIYDKQTNGWHAVDSRETAPLAATEDMFAKPENKNKSLFGGMAVAVPGEVKGLYEIHKRFGRVAWKDLVMPSVRLCQEGVPLTSAVHSALVQSNTSQLQKDFFEYFDKNGNIQPVGTPIKLLKLADTLQKIADDPLSFYNGSLADDIVNDIKDEKGKITVDDMMNYTVKWTTPSVMNLPGNLSIHSMPAPGSGPVLGYILNILSGYKFNPGSVATDADSVLTHHRIVEAMKFAYGKRTNLGDEDFINVTQDVAQMESLEYGTATRLKINDSFTQETNYYNPTYQMNNDQGTAHISVIDAEGNAVSVTSTINTYFGSKVKGNRTGIIFNNEMDDFSTPNMTNYFGLPASPANFIKPGKRPMSSMCPAIVVDNTGKIKLVTGAAGGSKITTATALNIIDVLWLGMSLPASVDRPRLHHQLIPAAVQVEDNYPQAILSGLKAKGHMVIPMQGISVVQSASVVENGITAVADFRKGGQPSGY